MSKWGGKRPGAGRKQGHLSNEQYAMLEARSEIVQRILTKWNQIIDTMITLALGNCYVEQSKNHERIVYKRPPDQKALTELIEIVIGKPKQNIDSHINISELDELSTNIKQILSRPS